jgi:hypothetical protein
MCYLEIKNALASSDLEEIKNISEHFQVSEYIIMIPNKKQEYILNILVKFDVLSEIDPPYIAECNDTRITYLIKDPDFFEVYLPTIV